MSLASQVRSLAQRSAAARAEWFPTTISIAGVDGTLDLAMTAVRSRRDLVEGGLELEHDAILRIPAALALTPALGLQITRVKDSARFRVAEVRSPGTGEEWVLGLKQI